MSYDKMKKTEEAMTKAFIDAFEAGAKTGKYDMPWDASGDFPTNATTGKTYGGSFNGVWLMLESARWGDNRWAGASQWKKAGNMVRKDERGTSIFFPRFKCAHCGTPVGFAKKCRNGHELKTASDKAWSGWGTSYVFNNQQTRNPLESVEVKDVDPAVGFEKAAELVQKLGADLSHGGGRAFYRPSEDKIVLPEAGKFKSVADYWAVCLHEHAHWTGAASRLNRPGITDFSGFGSESYAFEELIAEIGSAFVCKHLGIERPGLFDNHVAYVASWKKRLAEDPSAISKALKEAGKVMRYLVK